MVSLIEVLSATYNLQGLRIALFINISASHINLSYPHMIRIGMCFFFQNLARNHVIIYITCTFNALNTGAR